MAAPNLTLYRYALELVKFYNTIPSFRTSFPRLFNHPRITYKGWPLKLYVKLIAQIDRQYTEYTRVSLTAENTGELFEKFWKNPISFRKLEQSTISDQPIFPLLDHQELLRIDQIPDGETKQKAFENFLTKKEQADQEKTSGGGGKIPIEEKFPEPEPYQPEEQEKHGGPNLPQPNLQDIKDTRDLIKTGGKLARGLEFGGTGTGAVGVGGAAGGGAAGAGTVAGGSAVAGVSLGAGWVIVLAILIVILIFILGAILSNLLESSLPTNNQINQTIAENKVSISKSGPDKIDNGGEIQYDLNITYRGTIPANIEVTDKLPDQTSFISASDGGNNEGDTIKWTLPNMLPNGSKNITLIIKPEDDIWVSNTAEAKVVSVPNPGTGGTSAGGSSTGLPPDFPNPNQDNCGGKYDLKNPLGNFGDPACAYTKDDLYKLLKREDPVNADYWFNTVVKCESGYNPNAYGDHSAIGTPDAAGAWGLYQMGRGKNGKYDHGDVEWEEQTINAIQYNQNLIANRLGWRYWQCAKDRW